MAAGNTDTINGFYQSRTEMGMGRKHQHLIIRKQYQTGAAAANRFYEMYRVLRPNKGLVAFEMRGSRDGGGLEARAAPTRHRACPLACYLPPAPFTVLTCCLSSLGARLRKVRPCVAAGARRGRGSLAQPLS